jgi:peptide/nickel transport system permease protein
MHREPISSTDFLEIAPRISEFKRIFKVFARRKIVILGLALIVMVTLLAIFAPLIAPYDPNVTHLDKARLQPNREYLLGTDDLGRDVLSRIIYGTRVSLVVGIGAVSIAALIGMTMGLIAGYYGGIIYTVIMRVIDALMSFPPIMQALIIAIILGPGLQTVIIALGVGMVPTYARLMCGQVLSIKENDYILRSRTIGANNTRIMSRHILPNAFPPLIVMITLQMGAVIIAEAGLSFLGLGIPPPTPSWGGMINEGRQYLLANPLISLSPGFAIMLLVFGFNMVGDGLRDALDPRLRGTL